MAQLLLSRLLCRVVQRNNYAMPCNAAHSASRKKQRRKANAIVKAIALLKIKASKYVKFYLLFRTNLSFFRHKLLVLSAHRLTKDYASLNLKDLK